MGRSLNRSICVLHCLLERDEPHTNKRDLYSLAFLSRFADITFVNAFGPGVYEIEDWRFDLVIVSDSFMVMRSSPYWTTLVSRVAKILNNSSQKILFLQDDYQRLDITSEFARSFGIVVFSVFAHDGGIHSGHGVDVRPWLIGFADVRMDEFLSSFRKDWFNRPIDVGQRVYELSLEYGSEGRKKAKLAIDFAEKMKQLEMICDVSSDAKERFSGLEWFEFLSSCRATIGRHSGASLTTNSPFDRARALAIQKVYKDESFEKQLSRYLNSTHQEQQYLAASPRVFEAASLEVLQVLERSPVSYGLEEWNHFVPISPDFSDIGVVAKFIKSSDAIEMTKRCRQELYGNPRWRREKWLDELASSAGFTESSKKGLIVVPKIERDLIRKICTVGSRQSRLKIIIKHAKTNRGGAWHPIEAIHRWASINEIDIRDIVGEEFTLT
jgi:hypothetical protein